MFTGSAFLTEGAAIENARRSAVEVFTLEINSLPLEEERSALRPIKAETRQQSFRRYMGRSNANEAAPYQCSYSAIDWLRDRKPVHGVPHIGLDRSIFRDMLNETGGQWW